MYLADYRAVEYIATRPIGMAGRWWLWEQVWAANKSGVAGLNPKITHVIVNEPAGCDSNGPLYGEPRLPKLAAG
jgi:hypothetical protein